MKYVCSVCGWEYDESAGYPEGGIAPGTPWSEVPESFECPMCGVGKDSFCGDSFPNPNAMGETIPESKRRSLNRP